MKDVLTCLYETVSEVVEQEDASTILEVRILSKGQADRIDGFAPRVPLMV